MKNKGLQPGAPNRPRQPNAGWFKKQNTQAVTTGLETAADRRDELPAGFEHLRDPVEAFVQGSLSDEGEDDIPTRRRAQLGYRARVHRRILQVDDALERGLFDRRGKLRVAWITKLESLIATAIRIDVMLGLERRQKRVESPAEWLERRTRERLEQRKEPRDEHSPTENGEPGETDQTNE